MVWHHETARRADEKGRRGEVMRRGRDILVGQVAACSSAAQAMEPPSRSRVRHRHWRVAGPPAHAPAELRAAACVVMCVVLKVRPREFS